MHHLGAFWDHLGAFGSHWGLSRLPLGASAGPESAQEPSGSSWRLSGNLWEPQESPERPLGGSWTLSGSLWEPQKPLEGPPGDSGESLGGSGSDDVCCTVCILMPIPVFLVAVILYLLCASYGHVYRHVRHRTRMLAYLLAYLLRQKLSDGRTAPSIDEASQVGHLSSGILLEPKKNSRMIDLVLLYSVTH